MLKLLSDQVIEGEKRVKWKQEFYVIWPNDLCLKWETVDCNIFVSLKLYFNEPNVG